MHSHDLLCPHDVLRVPHGMDYVELLTAEPRFDARCVVRVREDEQSQGAKVSA